MTGRGAVQVEQRAAVELALGVPLFEALFERRSRRFGSGMEIPDGPLVYRSSREAVPLSLTEETVLLAAVAGPSGVHHGIEHSAATPGLVPAHPVGFLGRTAPSAAGSGALEVCMTNDRGSWVTRIGDVDSAALAGACWRERFRISCDLTRGTLRPLGEGRAVVPARTPWMSAHNQWCANRPGSTLFVPIVDAARQWLNVAGIYLASGVTIVDDLGDGERFTGDGAVAPAGDAADRVVPLSAVERFVGEACTAEVSIACQNGSLALEAMGLGGWLFTGIDPTALLCGVEGETRGFGFAAEVTAQGARSVLGSAGGFETLRPPYVDSVEAAVAALVQRKEAHARTSGGQGPWSGSVLPGREAEEWTAGTMAALAALAAEVLRRHGRLPATLPSVYARLYLQAHHVDTEFYRRYFRHSSISERHERHFEQWHATPDPRAPGCGAGTEGPGEATTTKGGPRDEEQR